MRHLSLALASLLSGCVVGEIGDWSEPDPQDPSDPDPSDPDPDPDPTDPQAQGRVYAFPGGDSIAIRWTLLPGATSYTIERDGTEIQTRNPGFQSEFPEVDGTGILDKTAPLNRAVTYRVLTAGGALVGEVTTTLTVKTPLPNITIDTSLAPDMANHMQTVVKPFLLTWYPKVGDVLAQPAYTPPQNLTLTVDPNYDGVAYCSGQSIVVSATFLRQNPRDMGLWIHEATHAMQAYQNIPGWITEGMADYTREFIIHDRAIRTLGAGDSYTEGYTEGSVFLAWIQDNYNDASFIHDLNVAAHGATYTDGFFVQRTGKSIDALWTEMTGSPPATTP